jgi:hypothetical protein
LYKGFGLSISASLVFSAGLAWRLSRTTSDTSLAGTIAWLFCLAQVASVVICIAYFGPVQVVFAAASAACLAWAAMSVPKRARGFSNSSWVVGNPSINGLWKDTP